MSTVWRTSTQSTGSTRFRLRWKPRPFMAISLREHCDRCWSGPRFIGKNCWTTGNWRGRASRSTASHRWSRTMDYHILEARYVGGHVLWLRFRDGLAGESDLATSLKGPSFERVRNLTFFQAIMIHSEFHTLGLPDGADCAP